MLPEIITAARNEGLALTAAEPAAPEFVTDPGSAMKEKADAMGSLIRSGVAQEEAAATVGLEGLSFPNLPTTIRVPEAEAEGIEGTSPAAP